MLELRVRYVPSTYTYLDIWILLFPLCLKEKKLILARKATFHE